MTSFSLHHHRTSRPAPLETPTGSAVRNLGHCSPIGPDHYSPPLIQHEFDLDAYMNPFLAHRPRNEDSFSTAMLKCHNTFSPFHATLSISPTSHTTLSALAAASPPASASERYATQFTLHSPNVRHGTLDSPRTIAPRTPTRIRDRISSPLLARSTNKLLNGPSLFSPNTTPSQLFAYVDLSFLLDPENSPVVRRSLGDVTPLFGRRERIVCRSTQETPQLSLGRELVCASPQIDLSPVTPSPEFGKETTPFLQRLNRGARVHPKQTPSSPSDTCTSLASPFIFQVPPAQFTPNSSPSTSPHAISSDNHPNPPTAFSRPDVHANPYFNPLSSPSSPGIPDSPLPFDLRAIFEEEDRQHRMRTRSTLRSQQGSRRGRESPMPPAAGRRTQKKRKLADSVEADNAQNILTRDKGNNDGKAETPLPRKKMRIERVVTSLTSGICWPMGQRTSTVPAQARQKTVVPVLAQTVDDEHSLPLAQTPAELAQSSSAAFAHDSQRTFPSSIPIHSAFPLFYRRFPVPSLFFPDGAGRSILAEYVLLCGSCFSA